MRPSPTCVCGHEKTSHEHYRAGSDCALCGAGACSKYRRARFRLRRPDPTGGPKDATGTESSDEGTRPLTPA